MRKPCFEHLSKRAQSLGNLVCTERGRACSTLGLIGQTPNMTPWLLTRQATSSVRYQFLTPQKDWTSWSIGFCRSWGIKTAQMACIIETTHRLLIAYLLEHGWSVYPVNPRTVDRRRSASGAKTDAIDAYLLAKTGRADFADLHRLTPDSEKVAELKLLTRDQDGLIQMQTRLVNQLTACLKDYYPVALALFSKLQQRSSLSFLQTYPTLPAAQGASVEQIAQVLQLAGHTSATKVAPKIFERLHQPSLQADAVTTRTKARLTQALIAQLLPLVEQIAAYDKEIERIFLSHEDNAVFSSLPGAGKRLAPRLLAEVGDDPSRYESAASLQALGGTSPVLFQSGTYSKPHRRLGC